MKLLKNFLYGRTVLRTGTEVSKDHPLYEEIKSLQAPLEKKTTVVAPRTLDTSKGKAKSQAKDATIAKYGKSNDKSKQTSVDSKTSTDDNDSTSDIVI